MLIDYYHKSKEGAPVLIHFHNTTNDWVWARWHDHKGKTTPHATHGGWKAAGEKWSSNMSATHPVSAMDRHGNKLATGGTFVWVPKAFHNGSEISITDLNPPAHINTDVSKSVTGVYGTIFLDGEWILETHPHARTSMANGV